MSQHGMKDLVRSVLPRGIRPRQIVAGPLRGSSLVTSWYDYPAGLLGRTERPLLDWFASNVRPGDTWIDVGAYCGYTAFALARLVGPAGRVFSFEPVPATAHCLYQGRALNGLTQVTVLPLGLGAPETLEMRRLGITHGMADATLSPGTKSQRLLLKKAHEALSSRGSTRTSKTIAACCARSPCGFT